MKTKEQVLEHLREVPYNPLAQSKVLGFLIGAGIKEEDEKLHVCMNKNGRREWSDFWAWWNSDDKCEDCPLCGMLNELLEIIDNEEDPEKVQAAKERYDFLVDAFDLDIEYEE